jgi:hypothetical protein
MAVVQGCAVKIAGRHECVAIRGVKDASSAVVVLRCDICCNAGTRHLLLECCRPTVVPLYVSGRSEQEVGFGMTPGTEMPTDGLQPSRRVS